MSDPLPQLVRDLLRLGVGMEVRDGAAAFTLPRAEPARSKAEKAVRSGLPLVQDHRDEFLAEWQSAAGSEPERCGECRASVYAVPEVVTWAFCASLYCPHRTDARSRDAKEWRRRSEWAARQRGKGSGEPIPD